MLSNKVVFRDICRGYSYLSVDENAYYVKHLRFSEFSEIDCLKNIHIEEAKKRGLPTVEEALNNLKEEGFWGDKEEEDIKQKETFVLKLLESKKNIYLKSKIDSLNKQLQEAQLEISELKNKRNSLIGNTCENHAEQKVTEEFIKFILYKDEDCKKKYFTDEEFDELSSSELTKLVVEYNKLCEAFSDLEIQKLILEDFYSYFMPYCDDPLHFFGNPIVELTFNQLKLLNYSRYFRNILQSSDKIPEEYRKDPEKLIDYFNANEKAKDLKEENDNVAASSIVGAKEEDYEYLNMKKDTDKKVTLSEEAKKKGGSLNMQELMELMGAE